MFKRVFWGRQWALGGGWGVFGGKGAVVAWRALEMLQRAGLCPADPDGISITEVRAGRRGGGGGNIWGIKSKQSNGAAH